MRVTFSEVQQEVKDISLLINSSNEIIPSVFSGFKRMLLPVFMYFLFYSLCPFGEVFDRNLWLGLGVISVFFWFFISFFLYGYSMLFSMLPKDAFQKYKVLRLYRSKAKYYYLAWNVVIIFAGMLSLFTIFNVIALAATTLLATILLAIFFSLDISRYQMSAIFGAASAAKHKMNG